MPTPRTVRLHPSDNVVVAVDVVEPGNAIADGTVALNRIPKGHKMTIAPVAEGEPVRKFGQIIGFATEAIEPGRHVHVHNLGFRSDYDRDYRFAEDAHDDGVLPPELAATFQGFRRPNGKIGTRNFIGILTSVNCSASVAKYVAQAVNSSGILNDYPSVDGVIALTHGTGCGMQSKGEGFDVLRRTLWGYAANPNVAAVLMIGLGCEVFQIPRLMNEYGIQPGERFQNMTIQETGGTRKTIQAAVERVREMLPIAASSVRETVPASGITLGLQCGGSDGYSGITANPALGVASDLLVRHGGTAALSETSEIYGAEHLLTARAESREVGEKLVERIKWWERYTALHGMDMDNNPSPGNKAGGLTTILEKSLGASAKGGSATLRGVYEYGEPIDKHGFVFVDTPGYDPVAVTGQVASGCNMIAFTTGRGSAFGCKPAPSMKLATNSDLYARQAEDMDINCGDILDGVSVEDKGKEIFEKILAVASGEKTKSEEFGYGDHEFVPWQLGATM